jgi:MSHA pilin protein MshD
MNKAAQRGFTLIELVVFIVIVGVGLAGIILVMNTVVKSSADPIVRKQALALADGIVEEILLKAYAQDASAAPGTNRATYDNVDDYNGLTQTSFSDWPPELSAYTVAIVVSAPLSLSGVTMKKISVTVARQGESVSMTAYRANY